MKKNQNFNLLLLLIFCFALAYGFKFLLPSIEFSNEVFELYVLRNTGAAFSIFRGGSLALGVVGAVIALSFVIYLVREYKKFTKFELVSCVMMLAGILSNMLERFLDGGVTDYIKLNFIDFPVFNIADIFINIGVCLLFVSIILNKGVKNV